MLLLGADNLNSVRAFTPGSKKNRPDTWSAFLLPFHQRCLTEAATDVIALAAVAVAVAVMAVVAVVVVVVMATIGQPTTAT